MKKARLMALSDASRKVGVIERLPKPVYVVLALVAAAIGATTFGVATAVILVIFRIETLPLSMGLFFGSAFVGLVIGALAVRRKRKSSQSVQTVEPPAQAIEPENPFGEDQPQRFADAVSEWYYVAGGAKHGPISEQQLRRLVAEGTLTIETQVWRKGHINWMRIGQAIHGFDLPPAVPYEVIGNGAAWVMALLPLIFAIGDAAFIEMNIAQQNASGRWLIVVPRDAGLPIVSCVALTLLLTLTDLNRLYKAGYRPTRLLFGALFTPIYLFMRANLLKQPPYYGFAWLGSAAISLLV